MLPLVPLPPAPLVLHRTALLLVLPSLTLLLHLTSQTYPLKLSNHPCINSLLTVTYPSPPMTAPVYPPPPMGTALTWLWRNYVRWEFL